MKISLVISLLGLVICYTFTDGASVSLPAPLHKEEVKQNVGQYFKENPEDSSDVEEDEEYPFKYWQKLSQCIQTIKSGMEKDSHREVIKPNGLQASVDTKQSFGSASQYKVGLEFKIGVKKQESDYFTDQALGNITTDDYRAITEQNRVFSNSSQVL